MSYPLHEATIIGIFMPIYPHPDQIKALLESPLHGPIDMLNLLKFRERAEYEDGRPSELSGREAYALYTAEMVPFVESQGGEIRYEFADAHLLMIGDGDLEWDSVAIMRYPSKQEFVQIATNPELAPFAIHRKAGLEQQLLVACTQALP